MYYNLISTFTKGSIWAGCLQYYKHCNFCIIKKSMANMDIYSMLDIFTMLFYVVTQLSSQVLSHGCIGKLSTLVVITTSLVYQLPVF